MVNHYSVVIVLNPRENRHLLYRFVSTKGETLISRYIFLVRIKIMSLRTNFIYKSIYLYYFYIIMAQRYTTFIPGYVFNIFGLLYTRVGAYPYTFYTTIACRPANLFCAKIFSEQLRNIELNLRAPSISILWIDETHLYQPFCKS